MALVVVAAGVTAGSASAVGGQSAGLQLGYTCTFSSGLGPVNAGVTAAYPATGRAGKPIRPTRSGITITLPHAAVADVTRPDAATLTLSAGLVIRFIEGVTSAAATWRDLRSAPTAIPRTGPLTLTATGAAPPVTGAAAGEATVAVGDLSLLFTARTANGRPASPAAIPVGCVPQAGQDMTLAKITVTGAPQQQLGAASPGPADQPANCLPFPKNLKLNPRFPLPPPLPGSSVFHSPGNGCAYATGFTDARKLHGAALVGPGLTDLLLGATVYSKAGPHSSYFYLDILGPGQLEYHGRPELPPARATLLGFGFMPVSATLQISEIGSLNVDLISCGPASKCPTPPPKDPPQKNIALFFGRVLLSVSQVDVNGVPLNVGAHCQTAPFNLELTGVPPAYNVSGQYGVLTGRVKIPPFKGCADGPENLDPLFTATVSGPGNFAKINQGKICTPVQNFQCPPVKPKPKH